MDHDDVGTKFDLYIKPKLEAGETVSVSTRTYLKVPDYMRGAISTAGWTVAPALARALEARGLVVIRHSSDGWRYISLPDVRKATS